MAMKPCTMRSRQIPGAFKKLRQGVERIKSLNPGYRITARTVIHRLNFAHWIPIVNSAMEMGLIALVFYQPMLKRLPLTVQRFDR